MKPPHIAAAILAAVLAGIALGKWSSGAHKSVVLTTQQTTDVVTQTTAPLVAQRFDEAAELTLCRLAKDTNSPITFNAEVGEYQLVYHVASDHHRSVYRYPLRYSPFTGAPLPSRRAELFITPSPAEVRDLKTRLSHTRSLAQVEAALGRPDLVYTNLPSPPDNAHGSEHSYWRAQYTYTNTFTTLDLYVTEHVDGTVKFTWGGKMK